MSKLEEIQILERLLKRFGSQLEPSEIQAVKEAMESLKKRSVNDDLSVIKIMLTTFHLLLKPESMERIKPLLHILEELLKQWT
jgi:hypothetical protein